MLRVHLWRLVVGASFLAALVSPRSVEAAEPWPLPVWTTAEPQDAGLDKEQLIEARDYALTGGGSGYITRGGKLVMSWGDLKKRYDLKSTTKSFGATALGVAILDGKIALTDKVKQHHPTFGTPPASNAATGWIDRITILHLATQTAGFEKPGGYTKLIFEPGTKWAYSDGGPNWLAECVTLTYKQDVDKLMFDRVFTPLGITRGDLAWRNNSYRDKNIDGIPRREFGSGISANVDAMARFGLLYLRGGMWNGQRILPEEFVKQAGTTVPAVVGLPEVDPKSYGNASDHYGLLWWNNADGSLKNVPRDAYWTWGLYDSLVVVIPSLDIVIARAGQSWKRDWAGHYDVLQPFLEPIVAAAKGSRLGTPARPETDKSVRPTSVISESDVISARFQRRAPTEGWSEAGCEQPSDSSHRLRPCRPTSVISESDVISARFQRPTEAGCEQPSDSSHRLRPCRPTGANDDLLGRNSSTKKAAKANANRAAVPPYPPSPVIASIEWAPPATIVRKARGGDNWPMTWADDDNLYTAYGDGKGFEPFVDVKLSMGLSRISGTADKFTAVNLRSPSIETRGDGASGKKASGMLMVDGTLYLLARNAGNSQFAWSTDHGSTWTWSDWKFTKSFGCPTFLNFGRDYAGARDEFVYVYSQDHDSAYKPADRMLLARVPKTRIREREAYEFFTGLNDAGEPTWNADVTRCDAVFTHPGRCYRSGITYNAALQRYLWCQIIPGPDTRFEGGFGIYDAPEPWGPWTTAFFTESWDIGPGETSSIPTKWISDDGRTIHLVFSGDDHFSVRRATLNLKVQSPAP